MFRSLRLRLALSHALVLIVILLVAGFAVQGLVARRLDSGITRELQDAARAEAEQLGESLRNQQPLDPELPSHAAVRIAVYDTDGTLVNDTEDTPSWLQPQPSAVADLRVAGEPVRIVTAPLDRMGYPGAAIVVARSTRPEELLLEHMRAWMALGGMIAVGFSLLAGWWLAGLAVRPVRRAYEAQASFAADASHELRTPLAFVRQGVEVMAEADPELGGQVLEEIDYLTALTERLLRLARAEGEGLELPTEPVAVAPAVEAAARRSRSAHHNDLTVTPHADELAVLADRTSLEAILDAAFENVASHGGGRADIDWHAIDATVELAVRDHGPGLPAGVDPERVFERFYRADPSRARATGGAGLGMPLARTLAEAQSGRLRLESTPGGGLTVVLSLPRATA